MNDKQIQWTKQKCNDLILMADFPATEDNVQSIIDAAENYLKQAKDNPEVRKALLQTQIYIDNMNRIFRWSQKHNE